MTLIIILAVMSVLVGCWLVLLHRRHRALERQVHSLCGDVAGHKHLVAALLGRIPNIRRWREKERRRIHRKRRVWRR